METIVITGFVVVAIIVFITTIILIIQSAEKQQKLFAYGKQVEHEFQEEFKQLAPKDWKYYFNLYNPLWHTDLDIYIDKPFKCVIDIKSAYGYKFNKDKQIVKIYDEKPLPNANNLINQMNITNTNVIIIWCPKSRYNSIYQENFNQYKIIICNGDTILLIRLLKQIFLKRNTNQQLKTKLK